MTHSIKKLVESLMVIGIELTDNGTNYVNNKCIACIKEKIIQNKIPKKSDVENPRRLYRIYSNVYKLFITNGHLLICDCLI